MVEAGGGNSGEFNSWSNKRDSRDIAWSGEFIECQLGIKVVGFLTSLLEIVFQHTSSTAGSKTHDNHPCSLELDRCERYSHLNRRQLRVARLSVPFC